MYLYIYREREICDHIYKLMAASTAVVPWHTRSRTLLSDSCVLSIELVINLLASFNAVFYYLLLLCTVVLLFVRSRKLLHNIVVRSTAKLLTKILRTKIL